VRALHDEVRRVLSGPDDEPGRKGSACDGEDVCHIQPLAAAYEVHDLDLIPVADGGAIERVLPDDDEIVLDGHPAGINLQPGQERGDAEGRRDLVGVAVEPDIHCKTILSDVRDPIRRSELPARGLLPALRLERMLEIELPVACVGRVREVLDVLDAVRVHEPQFVFVRGEIQYFQLGASSLTLEDPDHLTLLIVGLERVYAVPSLVRCFPVLVYALR
jgi:hypothetical protein